jgi:hypothetical protein
MVPAGVAVADLIGLYRYRLRGFMDGRVFRTNTLCRSPATIILLD